MENQELPQYKEDGTLVDDGSKDTLEYVIPDVDLSQDPVTILENSIGTDDVNEDDRIDGDLVTVDDALDNTYGGTDYETEQKIQDEQQQQMLLQQQEEESHEKESKAENTSDETVGLLEIKASDNEDGLSFDLDQDMSGDSEVVPLKTNPDDGLDFNVDANIDDDKQISLEDAGIEIVNDADD